MSWVGGALFGGIGVALLRAYFFTAPWRSEPWAVVLLLFGIVFFITGGYILFGPWLQRFVRRRTFCAVTDRRVIIVNERPWHRVMARGLDQITSTRVLLETADGSGDIELYFSPAPIAYPAFWMENDFEFISNVREVETLLLLARSEAAATFPPSPATQWPSGILGHDAPAALAWLFVLIVYLCAALYPILIWVDLKELSRKGLSVFAFPPAYSDQGPFTPFFYFSAAPVLMVFCT